MDGDDAHVDQSLQRCGADATRRENGGIDSLGGRAQEVDGLDLPGAFRHGLRQRKRRGTDGAKCRRHPLERTGDVDQAVPLQRRECAIDAAAGRQRVDACGLAIGEPGEDLGAQPAFERQPLASGVGDLRVALALDPGARRHRRRERLAGATGVVLSDPLHQAQHVRGQKRLAVEDVDDVLELGRGASRPEAARPLSW